MCVCVCLGVSFIVSCIQGAVDWRKRRVHRAHSSHTRSRQSQWLFVSTGHVAPPECIKLFSFPWHVCEGDTSTPLSSHPLVSRKGHKASFTLRVVIHFPHFHSYSPIQNTQSISKVASLLVALNKPLPPHWFPSLGVFRTSSRTKHWLRVVFNTTFSCYFLFL